MDDPVRVGTIALASRFDLTCDAVEDTKAVLTALHAAGWRIVRIDPDDVYATFGNPGHRYHHIVDEWAPAGAVPAEGQEPPK